MGSPLYISVVLPLALSTPYTYAVPEELKRLMVRGLQVLVPLGERLQAGIVWQVGVNGLGSRTVRKVQAILDPTPVVLEGQLQLWEWMAEYYCCTLGDMVRATLPAGLRYDRDAYVCACYPELPPLPSMPFLAKEMLGRVQLAKELKLELLLPVKGDRDHMKALKYLMDLGLVVLEERIRRKSAPRAKIYYQVPRNYLEKGGLKEVVQSIKHIGQRRTFAYAFSRSLEMGGAAVASISRAELLAQGQATPGILSALEKKGLLLRTSTDSAFYTTDNEELGPLTQLSEPQQQALEQLQASMRTHGVTLLHGVTGSGKTEIYIHLIAKTLAQGKQVLYLLPEIALTEQIIGRLSAVFGARVGVYHSRLSDSERTSLYNALRVGGGQSSLTPEPHG
ncbi:MAG: DEAD/DEAH box helicase, partial [Bacteroides sp.]